MLGSDDDGFHLDQAAVAVRQYKKKRSEEVAVRFGQNVARERRKAGLSQEELAHRASLHRTEVGMLEHGQRVARIDTVTKLAGAMAIEPAALLDGIHWTPQDHVGGGFSFSSGLFGPRPNHGAD